MNAWIGCMVDGWVAGVGVGGWVEGGEKREKGGVKLQRLYV